jgi:hypothetical protein
MLIAYPNSNSKKFSNAMIVPLQNPTSHQTPTFKLLKWVATKQ